MEKTRWEIDRVSTPERIFKKISEEMARPVGIILFGADCELKDEVLREFQEKVPEIKVFRGAPSTHEMMGLIHSGWASLFVLSSMESYDHELRHECVEMMRRIGAKNVIGVYVKTDYQRRIPTRDLSPEAKEDRRIAEKCINRLKNNPPNADGLDYLVVIEEEKEG